MGDVNGLTIELQKIVIASEHMTDILLNMLKAQAAQNDLQFSKDVAVKLIEKFYLSFDL
jgi:hypothetical protein